MPKPLYVICSESGVEDKLSGTISIFNIVETVSLKGIDQQSPDLTRSETIPRSIRVTAAWMRDSVEESKNEYEFQILFKFTSDGIIKEDIMSEGSFFFEKPIQRFVLAGARVIFKTPGIFEVVSRTRKAGDDNQWHSQEYPIFVEEISTQALACTY